MRARRLPGAASWALSAAASIALSCAVLLVYADQTMFDADGFAGRADAALQTEPVRAVAARRAVDAAITAKPSLVAVRPVLEAAAAAAIRTDALRSLLRAAARDLHRSAFDRHSGTVTLIVADAGILIAQAARRLDPSVAARLPTGFETRMTRVATGADGAALSIAERAERVRPLAAIALGAAALLSIVVLLLSRSLRAGAFRLGTTLGLTAGLLAVAAWWAPRLLAGGLPQAEQTAVRAAAGVWLKPLTAWTLALAAVGAVVALVAASVVRPVDVTAGSRRAWRALIVTPSHPAWRTARALSGVVLGIVLIAWPSTVLKLATVVAGMMLVLTAIAETLRLTAAPPARESRPRLLSPRLRTAAVAALLVGAAGAAGALAADDTPRAAQAGRCNGHRELCDRPLDHVAFAGTHNSMAADGEPGWLFVAQDAGIQAQLADGIRALLIDTHYGFPTPRGVASQLATGSKSRDKVAGELGDTFVRTAERLRKRIGFAGGERELFLCHGYCEVGATKAVDALAGVHRFLVTHPEEVLVLSIEDDTSAASTAAAIRDSGLSHEVYRGAARPPWPTLREMIDRDERVLVLVENDPGHVSWMHLQEDIAQETPYQFRTATELASLDTCRANRGGTRGSLLLVNHWVDTSPAPRPAIADQVNARTFLDRRLDACRKARGMLPNIVAVDFYRRGDVFGAVNALNRVH